MSENYIKHCIPDRVLSLILALDYSNSVYDVIYKGKLDFSSIVFSFSLN